MHRRATIASCCLLAALSVSGCGHSDPASTSPPASVAITGLYPHFAPSEARYVSRCGRGAAPIEVDAGRGTSVRVGSGPPRRGRFPVGSPVRPGDDFRISVSAGGESRSYQVRCLPADFPEWGFQRLRPIQPGLFTVSFTGKDGRPWIIVFDHRGVPRWWYSPHTGVLWSQILSDGTVAYARSFGDGYGLDPRMADEIHTVSGKLVRLVRIKGEIIDGHEFRELANGNVLVDSYTPGGHVNLTRWGGPRNATVAFAELLELTPTGRVVWRWNSRGKIGPGASGRWWHDILANGKDDQGATTYDAVHVNSIEPRGKGEIVMSSRHTDAIYGIQRATGRILWKLGGTETAASLRIVGDPASKDFGGQHDVRVGEHGDISVYDNGKDRPRRPRVVRFRLNLKKRTATYLGQLNDPRITRSHCCGSARPLAGGGWLVSWGDNPLITGFDRQDHIAFRLELPASTFRAVPAPPGATSVAALNRGLEAMEP